MRREHTVATNGVYEMGTIPSHTVPQTVSNSRAKCVGEMTNDRKNYAIGIGLLLTVVLLWTSSNYLTQVTLTHPRCDVKQLLMSPEPVRGRL
jgi:hypothetical protein